MLEFTKIMEVNQLNLWRRAISIISVLLGIFGVIIVFLESTSRSGVESFRYPRNPFAILFEFLVFIGLMLAGVGFLLTKRWGDIILHILALYLFFVSVTFIVLNGGYEYLSRSEVNIAGYIFLIYSVTVNVIIGYKMNLTIAESNKIKSVFFLRTLIAFLLFALWVSINAK